MRPRDIALVAAVLSVGGFAAADALRGNGDSSPVPPARTNVAPTGTAESVETVRDTGGLPGRLLLSDAACRVRELDLRSGTLAPYAGVESTCSVLAPAGGDGSELVVARPSPRRDVLPYRLVDLARADPDLLGFVARSGSVVWSPGGERLAWCEPSGRGQELVIGSVPHTLPACPVAYTDAGVPVFVEGRWILAGEERLVRAPGRVEAVSFASDGGVAVAAGGTQLVLYGRTESGALTEERRVALPVGLRHLRTVFSPTLCHAALLSGAFPPSPTVFVVDVRRCPSSLAPATFSGRAASWSPDGRWLAVAERRRIVAQPLLEGEPAVTLPIAATDLAWKP